MREILFRGKRTDNGDWVESPHVKEKDGKIFLCCCHESGSWLNLQWVSVLRDTICGFSGHADATGKKVFGGDILQNCKYPRWRGVVLWDATKENFHVTVFIPDDEELPPNEITYIPEEWEVIGNIDDHPELLGGADNG